MIKIALIFFCLSIIAGCSNKSNHPTLSDEQLKASSWSEIKEVAKGSTVYWMHWRGDPSINKFTDDYVSGEMKKRYGINVITLDGQGATIFSRLLVDKQSGESEHGNVDLIWINGETFHQLHTSKLLYGPFLKQLPNYSFVDADNPIIKYDFEKETEGYECPWGTVQLSLIYNSEKVKNPPETVEELRAWIKANPNRFTYDQQFTGITFMKSLLYALGGGVEQFQGGFDSTRYREKSKLLWDFLNDIKPYLWRKGEVYPENVAKLHFLFANGEIDFTMSNNDAEVDNKILQGVLPKSSKGLAIKDGTIANTHYQGIPFNSSNKAGAMVLCNFLISPDAQYEKSKPEVWADGSVLDISRLPAEWKEKFSSIPNRNAALPRDYIRQFAKPEVAAQYHERILEDWRNEVLRSK